MCKNLVTIKNPNFGKRAYGQQFGNLITVNPNLVPKSEYIKVPCGHCAECRARKISEYIQRAIIESFTGYIYFITLTYNNENLPCINIDGENYFFADYDDVQEMFKRFRAGNHLDREFRYLTVNEYGTKKHRPHFHCLIFVAKSEDDTEETPHFIRDIIFNNLGNYFAKNIGTRKNPVYKKLFTYKEKINTRGIHETNYFVKYVEPKFLYKTLNYDNNQDVAIVKSIRYLCGYVNKASKYEEKLNILIERYKESDTEKYLKLRHLLKSQVRFSKGFGCGFENKRKFYMEKISVRCSANVHVYSEIVDSLPNDYVEFCDMYPEFNEEILEWRDRDFYRHFSNWKRCLNGMTADEYMYHCVYLKYFKEEFNARYNRYKKELQPTISKIFSTVHDNYLYMPSKVQTSPIKESKLYKYLRSMVDESINKKLPCISFKMIGSQTYVPMCKYYKDRVCTFDDTYNLYKALGVKNYEEWLELFEKTINNNKELIEGGNKFKYHNDDELDDEEVKKFNNVDKTYNILFSNRKQISA